MKNISKQFAAWATNFKNSTFLRVKLKLTFFYTVGILVILVIFSLVVYSLFAKNITQNLEYEGPEYKGKVDIEAQILEKAQDRLQAILLTVDGLIVIFVGGISYYLAGKTLKPIESAYAKQKKFIADSAHELRTPLAVMKTGAEAVLSDEASKKEEYKKLVKDFLEELNFLTDMVNDLLFLAREDNLHTLEYTKTDLGALVHKQIGLIVPYAKAHQVRLEKNIKGNFFVKGNRGHLKRLVANLIKNAIDYNCAGGKVLVSLRQEKKEAILKVVDTGIGISQEGIKHIFDRFYKTDQARVGQNSGAGLGLSIVKEIVNTHKGKIKVNSEINKGTEIIISLPLTYS